MIQNISSPKKRTSNKSFSNIFSKGTTVISHSSYDSSPPIEVRGKHLTSPETDTETAPKSSLKLYLQEIGKTRLLKPEEEVILAGKIQKGDKEARNLMIRSIFG